MKLNIYNNKLYILFINQLTIKGKKIRFLKKILKSFRFLKFKKFKPNIFFFFILCKLKPLFYVYKLKFKKKKGFFFKMKLVSLEHVQAFKKSIK